MATSQQQPILANAAATAAALPPPNPQVQAELKKTEAAIAKARGVMSMATDGNMRQQIEKRIAELERQRDGLQARLYSS